MERTSNQPTFPDSLTSDLGGRRPAAFFSKCEHIDEFIENERHSVRADSAYVDKQKLHNRLVAGIRAVVEQPFAWMKNSGYGGARHRGMR